MDDKTIMDNLLSSTKSMCDLMMHGTIESSTPDVHRTFGSALTDSLTMQNEIYRKMTEKGWYPPTTVEQSKIEQTKQKFQNQTQSR